MLIQAFGFENAAAIILVLTLAFAYHEFGHAIVADRLGDPTPRQHGLITLNPIPHLSLIGLVMLVATGFGWASTPITPGYLRGNKRRSHALVAIAGPLFNLIMALLWAVFAWILGILGDGVIGGLPDFIAHLLVTLPFFGIVMNFFLIFFNLMPIPPLDGFTVLLGILPRELGYQLEPLRRYGFMILLGLIFLLPVLNINIFGQMFELSSMIFGLIAPDEYQALFFSYYFG